MSRSLLQRAGDDTLGKLERAAALRFREANKLRTAQEPLGALYLFGYSVEIRLKIAYYRTIGLTPQSLVDPPGHRASSPRKVAEDRIKTQFGTTFAVAAGHDLLGWAKLLEATRANPPINKALSIALARDMMKHTDAVAAHWREYLRYRANAPTEKELQLVRAAAAWFSRNRKRLWS